MASDGRLDRNASLAFRHPCSSDDLAMGALVPPSPILTPSSMTTGSSEEVPLFLFNSEFNNDFESRRDSTLDSFNELTRSNSVDTIQSTRTCATFGTFGQFRNPQNSRSSLLYQSAPIPNNDQDSELALTDISPAEYSQLDVAENVTPDISSLEKEARAAAPLSSAVVSPSPSASSCSSSTLSDYFFETQPDSIYSVHAAGDLHSTSILHSDSATSLPGIAVSNFRHDRKASSASGSSAFSLPSLPSPSTPVSRTMLSHAELPLNLAWLKDTLVEMLIDQEGFRSITPSFRFAGFSANTRSLDPTEKVLDGGAVQFIPISRQTFNFHYAPFDGQPVLRRISVSGTSRDHVSRQATLSLKSNGVYTVRGVETSIIPSNGTNNGEPPKLRWKLDYYVDDRRGSSTFEGEKTFTPLTFSCSPMLLHALQGKKIRLMHVMKKSVVTKIVAERMELPKAIPSRSPSPPILCETAPSSPPPLARADPSKAHIWNLHIFQSHGHSNRHVRSESSGARVVPSPLGANRVNETHIRDQQQIFSFLRHRRSSSAGERSVTDLNCVHRGAERNVDGKDGSPMPAFTPNRGPPMSYDRHIVPPSKLSKLLDNIENAEPALYRIDGLVITGLTPAPRNR